MLLGAEVEISAQLRIIVVGLALGF